MSASFPTSIFEQRPLENRAGVVFDSEDALTLYAEDLENLASEIVALETYLKNPQAGGVGSVREVAGEELSGLLNGTNRVFSSAHLPIAGTYKVFYNGLRMSLGVDYTLDDNDFTFNFDLPSAGSRPVVDYKYIVTA